MPSKPIRVLFLLLVLAWVGWYLATDRGRVPNWSSPLFVVVYPYNADGSEAVDRYIGRLGQGRVSQIEAYMADQARRYELDLERPFHFILAGPTDNAPDPPPGSGRLLDNLRWGLGMRVWRWRFDHQGLNPDIIVIARYHARDDDPEMLHSVGMDRVRVALANLHASAGDSAVNQVILAHEVLHTVGASDLYDRQSGVPNYPEGYAEPDQRPRYPQRRAELMAGRIPVAPGRSQQAGSLERTVIGPATAREIGWLRD